MSETYLAFPWYRIVEHTDGSFSVERKYDKISGHLWWRRTVVLWETCNALGRRAASIYWPAKFYPCLSYAQAALKRFVRGDVVHDVYQKQGK
jgi:hypothetical protein